MASFGVMSRKVSTCLYIDRAVMETARRVGLNVSRVSENALIEAIGRLRGRNQKPASRADRQVTLRAGTGI